VTSGSPDRTVNHISTVRVFMNLPYRKDSRAKYKALSYQESRLSSLLTASVRGVRRVGNSGGCGHFFQHGVSIRHFQRGCAVRSAPSAIDCDKFPASFRPPVTADDCAVFKRFCVSVAVCYCGPSTHARPPQYSRATPRPLS
jgi:hypothetical protein